MTLLTWLYATQTVIILLAFAHELQKEVKKIWREVDTERTNTNGEPLERSDDHTVVDEIYRVEDKIDIKCYKDREAIKINNSWHAVEKGSIKVGELVIFDRKNNLKLYTPNNSVAALKDRYDDIDYSGNVYQFMAERPVIGRASKENQRKRYEKKYLE